MSSNSSMPVLLRNLFVHGQSSLVLRVDFIVFRSCVVVIVVVAVFVDTYYLSTCFYLSILFYSGVLLAK